MNSPPPSRISFHLVCSPLLVAGSFALLILMGTLLSAAPPGAASGSQGRMAVLVPLILMAVLMALEAIHRVEIGAEGIGTISLASLLLGAVLRSSAFRAGRTFRLTWSSVDAVELRISRFQSPLRRRLPRGWLVAGSAGRKVRIPIGHPCFLSALAILRRSVHPYFLHLPSRDWEGRIPPRPVLAAMLRRVIYDPSTTSEFITDTARACLLWGNFSRAERLMDLALAKREDDARLLDDYFIMMKRLGNIRKAKPALERLVRSRRAPLDLVEMAEVHHAEGDEKEAAERLLQAAEIDQTSGLAHFLLGCLYVQREGLEAAALDQWKKGLDRARHPHLLAKLRQTYQYHRDLLTRPGFLEEEHRRHVRFTWARRLGSGGIGLVLGGMALWWFCPGDALPSSWTGGSLLVLGSALLLAAILMRRRARRR